jgi:hypothetical protein
MVDIASDLWNVFDLIALKPFGIGTAVQSILDTPNMIFVQVTSSSNHAARRNKIIASSEAKLCVLAGARVLVQSWKKVQHRYQSHDEFITLDQFVYGLPETIEQYQEDQVRQKLLARGEVGVPLKRAPIKDSELPF